jgi:putative flippase GtrA
LAKGSLIDVVRQWMRYAVVGILSNVILYALFILFTRMGMEHKVAMTVLYIIGVLQTFTMNRRWTFDSMRSPEGAFGRYLAAYGVGYLFNFSALWWLVDSRGYYHEWVQAILVFVTAALLFFAQKYWVFAVRPNTTRKS